MQHDTLDPDGPSSQKEAIHLKPGVSRDKKGSVVEKLTSLLTTNSRYLLHHHLQGSQGWDSEIMLLADAKQHLRHDHYVPAKSVLVYRREHSIILQYQTNCLLPVYHCWAQIVLVI